MAIFVGRDRELRALDEQLDAVMAVEARVVLVSGEPGVGKTRLVEELSRRAEARGFAGVGEILGRGRLFLPETPQHGNP